MDITAWFARYRPYLAIVAAVTALIAFLPGSDDTELASDGGSPVFEGSGSLNDGETSDVTVDGGGLDGSGATAGDGGGGGTSGDGGGGGSTGGTGPGGGGPVGVPQEAMTAACDPNTGRIKVPTIYAPPCVPAFSGDNGGSTYQGVTADTIKVVYFIAQEDPAVSAALTAAGAQNQPPERAATMKDYVDYFNHHYESYGRKVELVVRQGSGDTKDDNAARADALKIATEDKAFAVIGPGPTSNQFVETLAAKGVLCICTTSQPQELYERLSPYIGYTSLMSSTQGYIQRAEYIGKRIAGRKAVHAGTSDALPLNTETRKFGFLWYETPENAYRSGAEFFAKELKGKYGVSLAVSRSFPSDYAQVQERAQPLIQAMKEKGVTSIIFSGDPISPAIFTREATKQRYFPEWIITGSALTDTTIFARTFDPAQWSRAFGVSFLVARSPQEAGAAYKTHMWHHGRPPTADNQYGVLYPMPMVLFTGIHLAGPNLTPQSWQNGLFSYPPTGNGRVTSTTVSWGKHGIWPFTDFTSFDDVTEIWWDSSATGEDEVGNRGAGMYRYVDGGKRFLPGQHPKTDSRVFQDEGSVVVYDKPPPGEEEPMYEHPKH
jgi:hypothetical protein